MNFVPQSREAGRHKIAQRPSTPLRAGFQRWVAAPNNSESLQGRHNPAPNRIDVTRF